MRCASMIIIPEQELYWCLNLFWFLISKATPWQPERDQVRRGSFGNRNRHVFRIILQNLKLPLEYYPKSFLIFTTYQEQVRCTIILRPPNAQQDINHVKYFLFNIAWSPHLRFSHLYVFIPKKVRKHPNGFLFMYFLQQQQN